MDEEMRIAEIRGGALSAKVMDYGANLLALYVDTKEGRRDIVLGYKNLCDYQDNDPNYGCTIARYANRIGGGKFSIDGQEFHLQKNDRGKNTLHSGNGSLQRRRWEITDSSDDHVSFSIKSPDGDLGFPGNMDITVTYTIRDQALIIDYSCICDQKSVFAPTNHSYFNLRGEGMGDILDTRVMIHADQFTHTDADSIPDGSLVDVTGTPMDFRDFHRLGERIDEDYEALQQAGGYDHNYVLEKTPDLHAPEYDHDGKMVYEAARARAADDSIEVIVYTDLPGMQLYTGNYISGQDLGKCGKIYPRRGGVAFETQFFPNAVNVKTFEQPLVEADRPFHTRTVYRFLTE
ncbi:MAG: galactose mutarotase [Lachnospiraceae bacterium]|nr:galactose mutarotase [Lachnospiraceae bacterium]